MKEFDWWTSDKHYGMENDIEDWLYPMNSDEQKIIGIDGKDIDVTSLESFYDYLVKLYEGKHNLTDQ